MSRPGAETACPFLADAAGYLLGALDDPARFRAHAAGCAECQAELARLSGIVDALVLTPSPQELPRELRERLLRQVAAQAEVLHAAGAAADSPPSRRRSSMPSKLLAGSLAASLALALAVTLLLLGGGSQTRIIHAHVAPAAAGTRAELRTSDSHTELRVANMPQPPHGKVYEVWLTRGDRPPQPTDALFSVTTKGSGSVSVPRSLRHVSEVTVTAEPLGGSPRPTSSPVITFKL